MNILPEPSRRKTLATAHFQARANTKIDVLYHFFPSPLKYIAIGFCAICG